MPWARIEDLPDAVRAHLPEHAQEIFLAAFNHAWAAHAGETQREETAFRIAWGAVKRGYRKAGDSWVRIGR